MSRDKKKKISVIFIYGLIGIFCIMLLLMEAPDLAGLESYTVISGSMEPKLPVGSCVYVKKRKFREIAKGDVIMFLTEEKRLRVTHRVMEIDRENQRFVTKGDANKDADSSTVKWENVCGVVVFSLPYLGYVQNFLGSIYGKITAGSILAGLFLLSELLEKENEEKEIS